MQLSKRFTTLVVSVALSAAVAGTARGQVSIAVSPESVSVAPGDTVTLELLVPVAGAAFNGYDAIVEYDPALLTFLPTSPLSLQEGASMSGVCGNTFHVFSAAGDSLAITDILLCPRRTLTGPAQLYTLHFRTSNTPGETQVRLRSVLFYDAGSYVNPVTTSDATIRWGVVLDAGPPARPTGLRLGVRANPGRGDQWFDVSSPVDGEQRLDVYDAAGRAVRHLEADRRPAGTRAVRWDGRDDSARGVPPGMYLVRFVAAGSSCRTTVVRLP